MFVGSDDNTRYTGAPEAIPLVDPKNPFFWEVQVVSVNAAELPADHPAVDPFITSTAIFDTSGELIILPLIIGNIIFQRFHGAIPIVSRTHLWPPPGTEPGPNQGFQLLPDAYQMWMYPCHETPQLRFRFAGTAPNSVFDTHPLDMSLGQMPPNGGGFVAAPGFENLFAHALGNHFAYCLASVVGTTAVDPARGGTPLFILGTAFLKGWYSRFHMGKEGVNGAPHTPPAVYLARAIDTPGSVQPVPGSAPLQGNAPGPSGATREQGTVGVGGS